jgi:hypothetical protein
MNHQVTVAIGGLPIAIRSSSREFIAMLKARYANFILTSQTRSRCHASIQLDMDIVPPSPIGADEDLRVSYESGGWTMRRGDFLAYFDPAGERGTVRQSANPYSIDSVIRIIHSLVLAQNRAGFLLHSASAIREGRALLFSGVSGAGKTTIARLAPPDAALLTDEISYVRRLDSGYYAFGTPFAGELGTAGHNVAAPIGALYFLAKGPHHRIRPLLPSLAAQKLLRNVLFFGEDRTLVETLFGLTCDFIARVPVFELTFKPEPAVWELIA